MDEIDDWEREKILIRLLYYATSSVLSRRREIPVAVIIVKRFLREYHAPQYPLFYVDVIALFVAAKTYDHLVTINDCYQAVIYAANSLKNRLPSFDIKSVGITNLAVQIPDPEISSMINKLEYAVLEIFEFCTPIPSPFTSIDKCVRPHLPPDSDHLISKMDGYCTKFITSRYSLDVGADYGAAIAVLVTLGQNELNPNIKEWIDKVLATQDDSVKSEMLSFFTST